MTIPMPIEYCPTHLRVDPSKSFAWSLSIRPQPVQPVGKNNPDADDGIALYRRSPTTYRLHIAGWSPRNNNGALLLIHHSIRPTIYPQVDSLNPILVCA